MSRFEPFVSGEVRIGGDMVIRSGSGIVTVSGRAEIGLDRPGLAAAAVLRDTAAAILGVMPAASPVPAAVFEPFGGSAESASIGAGESSLTAENFPGRVALYGTLEIRKDSGGGSAAAAVLALAEAMVRRISAERELPEEADEGGFTDTVRNPFG